MTTYTDEDRAEAPPGHMPLPGTDLELVFTRTGSDAVVHVNKAGIMICRIRVQDALRHMSGESLIDFSTYAPDFTFKVSDSRDGMARLKRSVGLT